MNWKKLKFYQNNILNYIPNYCPGITIIDDFYLRRPTDLYISEDVDFNKIKNLNCNLIVLPHNLIRQWKDDITTHTDLTFFFISSKRELKKIKEKGVDFLSQFNIVLCNATKYNDLVELTKNYRWERVFFDEAHNIHIPKSKFIYAKFYWFITATYKSIISRQNTGFLRYLFQNYARKLRQHHCFNFNKFILKTSIENVKQEFILEKPKTHLHLSEKPLWIQVLENSIDDEFPRLKEMMFAQLPNDMKKYLYNFEAPFYREELTEKNIVLVYLKWLCCREEQQLVRITHFEKDVAKMKSSSASFRFYSQIDRKKEYITKYTKKLMYYNKLKNLIKEKINKLNLCWICMKTFSEYHKVTCTKDCHQKVCNNCVNTLKIWNTTYNSSWGGFCLYCRNYGINIDNKDYNITSVQKHKQKYKTKIEHVYELLKDDNKRVLIFSNFTSLFNKYLDNFKENKIKYGILKGNNNVINKRMKDFKSGNIKVLMLNGKHYGSGLNLQDATDIIITHKITDDVKTQVIGRANRMGRKGILNVHYLIFDGELSDKKDKKN